MRTESSLRVSCNTAALVALVASGCGASVPRDRLAPVGAHFGLGGGISTEGRGRFGAFAETHARTSRSFHVGGSASVNVEPATEPGPTSFVSASPLRVRAAIMPEIAGVEAYPEGIYAGVLAGIGPHLSADPQRVRVGVSMVLGGEVRWRWNDSADSVLRLFFQPELTPDSPVPWVTSFNVQLGVGANSTGRTISVLDPDTTSDARSVAESFAQGIEPVFRHAFDEWNDTATMCRGVATDRSTLLHDALITHSIDNDTSCRAELLRSALTQEETAANHCRAYLIVAPSAEPAQQLTAKLWLTANPAPADSDEERDAREGVPNGLRLAATAARLPGQSGRVSFLVACGKGKHSITVARPRSESGREEFVVISWSFDLPTRWVGSTDAAQSHVTRVITNERLPSECDVDQQRCIVYFSGAQSVAASNGAAVGALALAEAGVQSLTTNAEPSRTAGQLLQRSPLPYIVLAPLPAAPTHVPEVPVNARPQQL